MNIKELLQYSIQHSASDLHLSAGLAPIVRIQGDMEKINNQTDIDHKTLRSMLNEIMSHEQQNELDAKFEIDFSIEIPDLGRFRVNIFHQNRGIAAVFRIIPLNIMTLTELKAPSILTSIIEKPRGLILVTGPTGSGKSTTLAAMIDHINKNEKAHILTIEDPIEFIHKNQKSLINQREVHRDTKSFSAALRSALREDPDIILVGEMRDLETIRLALTAAETGHLVFATLHTSSAPKTIDRIIDVFPSEEKSMVRSMLSESLQAVIAQVLVKKKDGGRIAAHEIMVTTPAIRNLIREGKIAQMLSAMQTGQSLGMQTLDQALQKLVKENLISQEEAQINI